ncbi:hypothetical protein Q3G72_006248 [Acer saccharum]|nr:hypothetical protein Q3G72_006248 [Acer saccharum]
MMDDRDGSARSPASSGQEADEILTSMHHAELTCAIRPEILDPNLVAMNSATIKEAGTSPYFDCQRVIASLSRVMLD